MQIGGSQGNFSTLENALSVCASFQLTQQKAQQLIDHQVDTINAHWTVVCESAMMSNIEQQRLWQRAVFNPFCFGR